MYFRKEVMLVKEKCANSLTTLLRGADDGGAIEKAQLDVLAVLHLAAPNIAKRENADEEFSREVIIKKWPQVMENHPDWLMTTTTPGTSLQVSYSPPATNRQTTVRATVDQSLQWSVQVLDRTCEVPSGEIPMPLTSMKDFEQLLSALAKHRICSACNYHKYSALASRHEGSFYGKDGEVVARVEFGGEDCISATKCALLLQAGMATKCQACRTLDDTLRSALSKSSAKEGPSKHAPCACMAHGELLQVARQNASELKRAKEEVRYLRQKQEQMEGLQQHDSSNLTDMFSELKDGIGELQHRLQNPVCQW